MAIGDIWRLAFQGTWQLQEYVSIFHIKFLSVGATPAGAVSFLDTNWFQLLKTKQSSGLVGYDVHGVQLVNTAPVYDTTIAATGTQVGDGLPSQIAAVVSLRTGYAGRSYRGRMYIGGFREADNDGGFIAATSSAIQTYLDDLVAAVGLGGANTDYQWGVWSRKLGQPTPTTWDYSAGWKPVSDTIVRDWWGTQRRRRVGVGS